ncbi:SusD/RagB family nutrient-binding outer membrane lipoprotein [Reichenbachiella sp. MALMAid0571]|uniref:SusD/RagB family nutrient-binding outer membrane lipoprotein n=1 Tax=Reichenbachiella sp. MALMAid0571 TaxID=3143939 RepID=UPI0032E04A05
MKIKKYIITVLSIALIITSCDDGFEEMNQDPFNPTETSLPPVFNSLTATMVKGWQEQTGLEYELMGLASQVTNPHANSGYLLANASNEIWENYYKYMSDARLFDRLVADYSEAQKLDNLIAQKNIIHAYKTFKMVDYFGDIPYYDGAKATDGAEFFYPEYSDQKTVYMDMMQMLKDADANMVVGAGDDYASLATYDVLFGDDKTMWRKFANSIRLRQALRAYDADNTLASHVSDILGGNLPLIEDGEDVEIDPVSLNLDLRGRIWAYSGGFVRFGETMFDAMSDGTDEADIFDPRLRLFSETNSSGNWAPMPFGGGAVAEPAGNPNAENRWEDQANAGDYNYSPINYWILTGRFSVPELVITAAEVHFLKAEAYAKGVGVATNMTKAREEYEAGIKSSIDYWFNMANFSKNFGDDYSWRNVPATPDAAAMTTMLTNPKVAWVDADALELIYTQRWISHFRQVPQAWSLWRQTKMTPQTGGSEFIFNRVVYPQNEQDRNGDNYSAQVNEMGGDTKDVKVWWMQ